MVLVVSFDARDGADPALAARLEDEVAELLSPAHDVARMDEVPPFDVHDYSAAQYLEACPPRRSAECTFVLGQRVDAEWALGASLEHMADDAEPHGTLDVLAVHLVQVRAARLVASVGVPVVGDGEEAVHGIARLVDEAVEGALALRDLRAGDIAVAATAREQAMVRRDADAAALAELEEELGAPLAVRVPVVTNPEGWILDGRGRKGQLLFHFGAGYAYGPWHQEYNGEIVRDEETLEPTSTAQGMQLTSGGGGTADLAVAFGVTSDVEVGIAGTWRTGRTFLSIDERIEGEEQGVQPASSDVASNTWSVGLRAAFAPYPLARTRPTIGAGLTWWTGHAVDPPPVLSKVPAPYQLVAQLYPGVETAVSESVGLYVRGSVDAPLIVAEGSKSWPGVSITGGLLVRVR